MDISLFKREARQKDVMSTVSRWLSSGRVMLILLLLGALIISACAQVSGSAESSDQSAASGGQELRTLRVAYPSIADMGDVPSLLAFETLRTKGYEVVPVFFNSGELAIQAVLSGDVDFGAGDTFSLLLAVQSGGDIRMFVQQNGNEFSFVGRGAIKSLQDVQGKTVANYAPQSVLKFMTDLVFERKAPDVNYNELFPGGSEIRAQALLNEEIDATPLELADLINLQNQEGSDINLIFSYAQEIPDLQINNFYATSQFLSENEDFIRDFIQAVLETERRINADPQVLVEQAPKYLPGFDPEVLPKIAQAYVDAKVWDINGGITDDSNQFTIDFYVETDALEQAVDPAKAYDRSYLDAVLEELGRS